MDELYKVVFVYPDGHSEDICDTFKDKQAAFDYGNSLLVQVLNNERFHGGESDDEFGLPEKMDPYFMIYQIVEGEDRLIFESKH